MGRLSAPQLAEFSASSTAATVLLEIDLPDGTTKRIADGPLQSVSEGYYKPYLVSLTPLEQTLDSRDCALACPERTAVVEDACEDGGDVGWFSRLAETYGGALHDAVVREYIASDADPADWLLNQTGRLVDWPAEGGRYRLAIRPLDAQLIKEIELEVVRPDDFPDCPEENLYTDIPLCYGVLSTRGDPVLSGYCSCTYVDDVNFRYLVCFGWVTVLDVFVGSTRQTSGYTVELEIINGRRYTLIDFTGDQGSATISANVIGYGPDGDSADNPLLHPIDQIRHFLANRVFGYAADGLWLDDTGMQIDGASFDAAKAALAGRAAGADYTGGIWITTRQRALDIVNGGLRSIRVPGEWTPAGKVGLKYLDTYSGTYPETRVFSEAADDLLDLKPSSDGIDAVRSLLGSWASDAPRPSEMSVRDPAMSSPARGSTDFPWGPPVGD